MYLFKNKDYTIDHELVQIIVRPKTFMLRIFYDRLKDLVTDYGNGDWARGAFTLPMMKWKVGSRVRHLRFRQNLSQEQFSKLVKIPLSELCKLENHRIPLTLKRAKKIAVALKISYLELL